MASRRGIGSILAADIGTVTTRAVLIDRVEGVHRLIARGEAPTTAAPPWDDVLEGLRIAINAITATTARVILDTTEMPIIPEETDRSGVDTLVASASAGKQLRAILVGLVPDVSLESGRRAAEDTYVKIEDVISLADNRTREEQVDTIVAIGPDLIIIVGGTDYGATTAMMELIRTVALGCIMLEHGRKPHVLFAGNPAVQDEVTRQIEERADVDVIYAENVRPTLEAETLADVKTRLGEMFQNSRAAGTNGFGELRRWTEEGILPTARAFGRMVHLMGQRADRDVLGVDIGSMSTAIAAVLGGDLVLNVRSDLGVGHNAKRVLDHSEADQLTRWLTGEHGDEDASEHTAVSYVWNKWLFPQTIPQTAEELDLELALAREVLRTALEGARQGWPGGASDGLLPHFDEIVASGAVLGKAPRPADSALVILDSLQPVGVTQLWLDTHAMGAALGTLASLDLRAVVEVIETGGFVNLGVAICPVGRARRGQVVLRAELVPEGQPGQTVSVRAGDLVALPLQPGLPAQLRLKPRGVDIGLPARSRTLDIVGGALGVIIDARGRPLSIPGEPEARRETMRQWRAALGGDEPL